MAKKVPLLPLSSEARESLLQAVGSSREPQLAKSLAALLAPTHSVTEAQVTPVLEELVATGDLQKYALGKGKPKYWDRDLQELTRDAVLRAIKESAAPLTAKEVAAKIAPPKVAAANVSAILDAAVAGQLCFAFPSAKATGKPSFWHQDLREIGRQAVLKAAQQAGDPFTANELAGRLQTPVKLSETDVTGILEETVAAGTLHAIPATTAKGKPRYWTHGVLELGCRAMVATINTKGPQTLTNLKKLLKGIGDAQFQQIVDRLREKGSLVAHPPLGTAKQEMLGTRPPSAVPYLQEVGLQLKRIVGLLKGAHVPSDELRRAVVQLLTEAGISFGTSGDTSHLTGSPTAAVAETVDLVGAMKRIEPGAERGALVGARELRRAVRLPKSEFDHAVLELARQGRLSLHRHDYATSLTQEERDELVTDGDGTFYVGMALRPR
ncbi:MAG: uncharacterized protein JWN70_6453 [Planctomycetaceae bacterium]|nr:uncharacterized protein [Planctomycetaceae bacterium]